jgi:RimJ/RimL family protein N-acetyltransferase
MSNDVRLRRVTEADLAVFFEQERDPVAVRMAAFTRKDPDDRAAFTAHWTRLLAEPSIVVRTVVADGVVAGSIASFVQGDEREVAFWVGREHWGKGVATMALAAFLGEVTTRPLFARAAKDNLGSIRVLAKCGFAIVGEGKWFSKARGAEIEEVLLRLD